MNKLRSFILKIIVLTAVVGLLTTLSTSCVYKYKEPRFTAKDSIPQSTRDSLKYLYTYHFTLGTNLQCISDSVNLAQLPIIDDFKKVVKGDNIVVADFMIQPKDTVDSVWVKVARDQETMGWIHENQIVKDFIPTSSISQFIYLFSHTHISLLLLLICILALASLYGRWHTGKLKTVFFDDIDSAYPLLMCFCMAMSATIYESMQMFLPQTWEHFYFNPTINPLKVPFILSIFLLNIWAFIIVMIAAVEDTIRMLKFTDAVFYIIGLLSACIFCYFFFIYTTLIYIGYGFMLYFLYLLIRKAAHRRYHYQCGKCGALLKEKGKCPKCGAINE